MGVERVMTSPHSGTLLGKAADGDEGALAQLYDRFAPVLHRAAYGMLGSREEADDAVQDVFVGLVRTRTTLYAVEDLNAYLFASLRRAARRIADRRKRERSLPESTEVLTSTGEAARDAGIGDPRLERALAALPFEQREVVALKIDGGLTFREIGKVLGASPNSAASRYRYALEKLRAALE
jgi:RNA polymerase sigma-70 factor (ECF subfamily)